MKIAVLALFFLFAISTTLPSASADDLVDIDGDALENGRAYYILSLTGRGIEVAQLPNDTHPVSVIQSATTSNGLPLILYTSDENSRLTTEDYVNIQFLGNKFGVWEVLDNSVKIYKQLQETGPFKVATYTKGLYKILYTPDSSTSTPLRVSQPDGLLNLVKGPLLRVKFQKFIRSSARMSSI